MNLDELYARLDSDDPGERGDAAHNLAQMGDAGARMLARALQEYPWLPAPKPGSMWFEPDEPKSGPGPLRRKSKNVTDALASIGRPAMKAIILLLRDPRFNSRLSALTTLFSMDSYDIRMAPHVGDAAEALADWLREGDPSACKNILPVFVLLRYKARHVAPALVSLYHSIPPEHMRTRFSVAEALLWVEPPADAVESVVPDFLERADEEQTKWMLRAMGLSGLGEPLVCALPFIERRVIQYGAAEDYNEHWKGETAAELLASIGAPAQETLMRLIQNGNEKIAACAAKAVRSFALKANPEPFYEVLLSRLARRDRSKIGVLDEDMVFSYAKEQRDLPPDIEARWKATRVELDAHYAAMREKNRKPEPDASNLPALLNEVSAPENWNDEDAAESILAIAELGHQARSAAPLLMRIAETTANGAVMCAARVALAAIARP